MATSGSTNYTVNRDRMIVLALKAAGKIADNATPTASESQDCSDILNMMLKTLQADGLKLWLRKKATVFLKDGVNQYSLSSSGAHATYSYTRTTVKVSAVAGATTVDITSTAGATAADFIGFVLDDGTSYWTTISTVTDSDTVTIPASGLTSAATAGNYVYFFTTKIDRPLRVLRAFVRDSSGIDTPVRVIAQNDYVELSNKTSKGRVNKVHYDPQTSSGLLYVWPQTSSVTDTLELIVQRSVEDMDIGTNDFDIPSEWYEPVLYGLAERVAINFQAPKSMVDKLTLRAAMSLKKVMDFDVENTSMFFYPEIR